MFVHKQFLKCLVLLTFSGCIAYAQTGDLKTPAKIKPKETTDSLIDLTTKELKGTVTSVKENFDVKKHLPDSVPKIKKPSAKDLPKVDSVGISFENGKLNLPEQVPSTMDEKMLQKQARDKLSTLPKTSIKKPEGTLPRGVSIPDKDVLKTMDVKDLAEKLPDGKVKQFEEKHRDLTDSVTQLVKQGEELIRNGSLTQAYRVYSEKALKKLYDSLGISKLDSVIALASSKQEVSKEDLLQAINFSMPSSPVTTQPKSFSDLPINGEVATAKDEIMSGNLGSFKLPQEVLSELPPIRGFQFPSDKFPMLDSLRKLNLTRDGLSLKEEQIKDDVEAVIAKKKPKFWDKTYFEGVLSYLKFKESNLFQMAPSLGFRVKGNFSVGLGPNILVKEEKKNWNVYVGYRFFTKAEIFSQRAYLQVEDITDPGGLSTEYLGKLKHSVLAGGGFLLPISKIIALNFSVLYRVNNENYSGGEISPWVFRLGLSSVKSANKKIN